MTTPIDAITPTVRVDTRDSELVSVARVPFHWATLACTTVPLLVRPLPRRSWVSCTWLRLRLGYAAMFARAAQSLRKPGAIPGQGVHARRYKSDLSRAVLHGQAARVTAATARAAGSARRPTAFDRFRLARARARRRVDGRIYDLQDSGGRR